MRSVKDTILFILACLMVIATTLVMTLTVTSKTYSGQDLMDINPSLDIIPTATYVFVGRVSEKWFGITIGNVVFLAEDKWMVEEVAVQKAACIIHEDEHVRQYAEDGFFGFLKNYLSSYVENRYVHKQGAEEAYRNIPYEKKALAKGNSEC